MGWQAYNAPRLILGHLADLKMRYYELNRWWTLCIVLLGAAFLVFLFTSPWIWFWQPWMVPLHWGAFVSEMFFVGASEVARRQTKRAFNEYMDAVRAVANAKLLDGLR